MNKPSERSPSLLSSNTLFQSQALGGPKLGASVAPQARKAPFIPISPGLSDAPTLCYYCPRCNVSVLTTARGLHLSAWMVDQMIAHPFHGMRALTAEIVAPGAVR